MLAAVASPGAGEQGDGELGAEALFDGEAQGGADAILGVGLDLGEGVFELSVVGEEAVAADLLRQRVFGVEVEQGGRDLGGEVPGSAEPLLEDAFAGEGGGAGGGVG